MIDRNSTMLFGDGIDPDMMRDQTNKLGQSIINQHQSTSDFTEAERILTDEDNRKSKQEELILYMGSPIYKHICNRMNMR